MAEKYGQNYGTDQNTPQTNHRTGLMSSKEKQVWVILADSSTCRYENKEKSHFPTKSPKVKPFLIQSVLESISKRFRESAIRQNIKLKLERQTEKTHSNNRGNYTHQNNGIKEKLQPGSFIYVWTIFEHQVKNLCASQKFQVLPCVRMPKAYFRRGHGHLRESELTSSININKDTIITV